MKEPRMLKRQFSRNRNSVDARWNAAGAAAVLLVTVVAALSVGIAASRPSEPPPTVLDTPLVGTKPKKVVIIGDSLTEGTPEGGIGDHNWVQLAWRRLQNEGVAINPLVSGRGGSGYVVPGRTGTTFVDEVRRLVQSDDDLVVVFGGSNDWTVPVESVTPAITETLSEVRVLAPTAALVVVGPVWPGPNPTPPVLAIRDALRDEAATVNATFVDPIADRWFMADPQLIGRDGTHPTDAGHAFISEALSPVIRSVLAARTNG